MKKSILLIIILFTLASISNAQNSKLVGSWLMTKAEVDSKIEKPYFITEFKENGEFMVMGMNAGTWEYNKASNVIVMKSDLDKDFNGKGKVINLAEKELIVDKDGARLSYRKVDVPEIAESNNNSGLMGMWEFKNVPYPEATMLVTFTEPDEFTIIQKEEGMSANFSGTWIYEEQSNSIIMIGLRGEDTFHGESKIVKIDAENLELENKGTVLKGTKKAQNATKIECLSFTEGDFYNEDRGLGDVLQIMNLQ